RGLFRGLTRAPANGPRGRLALHCATVKDPAMSTGKHDGRLGRVVYETELFRLQAELVTMQEWVRATNARIVVIFEGRDAAGKGSTIKRVTQYLNPRVARIVALPTPTERQRTQWYFQRYVEHLPAACGPAGGTAGRALSTWGASPPGAVPAVAGPGVGCWGASASRMAPCYESPGSRKAHTRKGGVPAPASLTRCAVGSSRRWISSRS